MRKSDRIYLWIINLLLAVCFNAAVLVFAEQIHNSGWPWFSRVLACWPTLLCFAAGLVAGLRKWDAKAPLCIGAIVVSAALMFFVTFPARDLGHIFYMALGALLGIYLFWVGLRGDAPYPPRMAIITVAALLIECMWFSKVDRAIPVDIPALAGLTFGAFLLSMFSLNSAGIASGLHNTKTGQKMRVPAGLRGKNLLLLILFIIIAVAISFIEPLRNIFSYIIRFIIFISNKISEFLSSQETIEVEGTPEPTEYSIEPTTLPDVPVNKPLSVVVLIFLGLVIILGVAIVIAVFLGDKSGGSRGGRGLGARRRRKATKRVEEDEYDDSVERLHDLRTLLRDRRAKASARLKKLLRRPQKMDDMPDDRARIRFAYYSMLRSRSGREMSRALTPLEVSDRQRADALRRLAEDYSLVRYDEASEPGEEQTRNAVRAMSAMRRR